MEGSENEQREGGFGGRRMTDTLRNIGAIIGFGIIIVTATLFIASIITSLSVLTARVDAQDVKITANTGDIMKWTDILLDVRDRVSKIQGKLGIQD